MFKAFNRMPKLLQFITAHALFCFVFFLVAVIPFPDGILTYKGQQVGFEDIWQNNIGIHLISIGLLLPVCAILFLKRWRFCRHFYSLVILVAFTVPYANRQDYVYLPFAYVVPAVIIIYLFTSTKTREYVGT